MPTNIPPRQKEVKRVHIGEAAAGNLLIGMKLQAVQGKVKGLDGQLCPVG